MAKVRYYAELNIHFHINCIQCLVFRSFDSNLNQETHIIEFSYFSYFF